MSALESLVADVIEDATQAKQALARSDRQHAAYHLRQALEQLQWALEDIGDTAAARAVGPEIVRAADQVEA